MSSKLPKVPVRFYPTEEWKQIHRDGTPKFKYAITNYGRLISYTERPEEGNYIKPAIMHHFRIFRYKYMHDGKAVYKHLFIHKLVAQAFLPPPTTDQTYVIHLDHNHGNNSVANLKWVTRKEMIEHSNKSPRVIAVLKAMRAKNKNGEGRKLKATDVILIKKKLADPNRKTRLKMIAKQFKISEMQLHRIKTGENWGHIKVN